jgi:hypothetical protein
LARAFLFRLLLTDVVVEVMLVVVRDTVVLLIEVVEDEKSLYLTFKHLLEFCLCQSGAKRMP